MLDSTWNHNPEKFRKECKRLRALCQRVADNEVTIAVGCLEMSSSNLDVGV